MGTSGNRLGKLSGWNEKALVLEMLHLLMTLPVSDFCSVLGHGAKLISDVGTGGGNKGYAPPSGPPPK